MPLKAGTKKITPPPPPASDGYAGSLAEDIETAFIKAWQDLMPGKPPPESNDQMRIMFIGIAQGVVNHLVKNAGSFKISVSNGIDTYTGAVTSIDAV